MDSRLLPIYACFMSNRRWLSDDCSDDDGAASRSIVKPTGVRLYWFTFITRPRRRAMISLKARHVVCICITRELDKSAITRNVRKSNVFSSRFPVIFECAHRAPLCLSSPSNLSYFSSANARVGTGVRPSIARQCAIVRGEKLKRKKKKEKEELIDTLRTYVQVYLARSLRQFFYRGSAWYRSSRDISRIFHPAVPLFVHSPSFNVARACATPSRQLLSRDFPRTFPCDFAWDFPTPPHARVFLWSLRAVHNCVLRRANVLSWP